MTATTRPGDRAALRQLGLGLFELLLVSGLYVVYRLGRLLTVDRTETARAHARLAHHLERALQLPSEAAIQERSTPSGCSRRPTSYYLSAHFPVTIAFLVWGFVARPRAEYLWARRLLVVLTLLGLVAHIVFPLAPPRMFPRWGFLDTMTSTVRPRTTAPAAPWSTSTQRCRACTSAGRSSSPSSSAGPAPGRSRPWLACTP